MFFCEKRRRPAAAASIVCVGRRSESPSQPARSQTKPGNHARTVGAARTTRRSKMYRVPDGIHYELLNWARWCWIGSWPHPLPPTRCGSAERDYRVPPDSVLDMVDPPPPPPIRPNAQRAMRVQEVWKSLPYKPRLVLKAEYPCHKDHSARVDAARFLGMVLREYETHLSYAVGCVEKEFADALCV